MEQGSRAEEDHKMRRCIELLLHMFLPGSPGTAVCHSYLQDTPVKIFIKMLSINFHEDKTPENDAVLEVAMQGHYCQAVTHHTIKPHISLALAR